MTEYSSLLKDVRKRGHVALVAAEQEITASEQEEEDNSILKATDLIQRCINGKFSEKNQEITHMMKTILREVYENGTEKIKLDNANGVVLIGQENIQLPIQLYMDLCLFHKVCQDTRLQGIKKVIIPEELISFMEGSAVFL